MAVKCVKAASLQSASLTVVADVENVQSPTFFISGVSADPAVAIQIRIDIDGNDTWVTAMQDVIAFTGSPADVPWWAKLAFQRYGLSAAFAGGASNVVGLIGTKAELKITAGVTAITDLVLAIMT